MKQNTLIAQALCLILITAGGASVVTAREQPNPRQAGASSVYFYDVGATDTHGSGKLMIDVGQHKFVFNGKDFDPSKTYALSCRTALSDDPRVFASAVPTPSGNLHVGGTWAEDAALPTAAGVVAGPSVLYPGTIQRLSSLTQPCYTLTYTDASQTYTVYLPANEITYGAGGHALPAVISTAVAVDYVSIDSYVTYTLSFRCQGVYYSAHFYSSCPQPAPAFTYELVFYASYGDSIWVGGDFTAHNTATGEIIHVPGTAYVYYWYDPTPYEWKQNDGAWYLAGTVHTIVAPGQYYDFQAFWWITIASNTKVVMHPDDPTVPQVWAYPTIPSS